MVVSLVSTHTRTSVKVGTELSIHTSMTRTSWHDTSWFTMIQAGKMACIRVMIDQSLRLQPVRVIHTVCVHVLHETWSHGSGMHTIPCRRGACKVYSRVYLHVEDIAYM